MSSRNGWASNTSVNRSPARILSWSISVDGRSWYDDPRAGYARHDVEGADDAGFGEEHHAEGGRRHVVEVGHQQTVELSRLGDVEVVVGEALATCGGQHRLLVVDPQRAVGALDVVADDGEVARRRPDGQRAGVDDAAEVHQVAVDAALGVLGGEPVAGEHPAVQQVGRRGRGSRRAPGHPSPGSPRRWRRAVPRRRCTGPRRCWWRR